MLPKEEKIKELLRQHGLDGAIVSSPENFHYVTGFAGHQHTVSRQPGFSVAVVSAREDVPTQLTTMDFEVPTFEKKSQGRFLVRKYDTWTGVKVWDEITTGQALPAAEMENSMDVLKKMVKDMDLANKKLGVELDYLTAGYYNSLCQAFPEARYENISDLFVFARSVKTPEEIQMFRTLCRAADEGFTAVSKIARVGVSERELVETFRKTVIATGVAAPSAWSMFSTGEAGAPPPPPPENNIPKGDVVKVEARVDAGFDIFTTPTPPSWGMEGADPHLPKTKGGGKNSASAEAKRAGVGGRRRAWGSPSPTPSPPAACPPPRAWSLFPTGGGGPRLTIPEENIIRKGDVVKFDAGVNAEFDFYTTDTSRSWVMEGADPTILKLKDRLYEGQRRMIAAAKPGLPMNELFHIAYDYVKEAFPAYRRGHQGHSISMGPATAEAPFINPTTTRPLEAGMVLAMEVPCYIRGVNGFNIEDMVLITEDGCEVLTPATPPYL